MVYNYVFNIDWLTVNFEKIDTMDFKKLETLNGYKVMKQDFGTPQFRDRYYVEKDNYKIFTILENPQSKAINQKLVQIQVSNTELYDKEFRDIGIILEVISEQLGIIYTGISRIDLCFDFIKNDYFNNLIREWMSNDVILAGRKKMFVPRFTTNNGIAEIETIEIGKRSNDRFARIYNKSIELNEKPKEYISQKHIKAGLIDGSIWRYEYMIKGQFLSNLNVKEYKLYEFFDKKTLIDLFRIAEQNHTEFKRNTFKGEINKMPTIPILNYGEITTDNQTVYLIKKVFENSLSLEKRTLKTLFREYYLSEQTNTTYLDNIREINERSGLKDYFDKKIMTYIEEFQQKLNKPYKFNYDLFRDNFLHIYNSDIKINDINTNEIIPF